MMNKKIKSEPLFIQSEGVRILPCNIVIKGMVIFPKLRQAAKHANKE